MTTYRHIIFLITIVAFLAAFLTFVSGCGGVPVKSELQIVYSQRETNNPDWRPPAEYTVQTSEGWDKETGCAVEIEHEKSGIVLRLVPAGEFMMGSHMSAEEVEEVARKYGREAKKGLETEHPLHKMKRSKERIKKGLETEHPLHKVKISEPFYIGKYEITQKQWVAVIGSNPSFDKGDSLPVEQVTWNDVQEFCRKAGGGLRLPSEAEWEYACRAGSTTKWYFGDNESTFGEYAWYNENSGFKTHEAGTRKPNAWGLYDMHGNVGEWCEDILHDNYNGAPGDGSAWTSGGLYRRICRGGTFASPAWLSRSATRGRLPPGSFPLSVIGFRVVVAAGAVR